MKFIIITLFICTCANLMTCAKNKNQNKVLTASTNKVLTENKVLLKSSMNSEHKSNLKLTFNSKSSTTSESLNKLKISTSNKEKAMLSSKINLHLNLNSKIKSKSKSERYATDFFNELFTGNSQINSPLGPPITSGAQPTNSPAFGNNNNPLLDSKSSGQILQNQNTSPTNINPTQSNTPSQNDLRSGANPAILENNSQSQTISNNQTGQESSQTDSTIQNPNIFSDWLMISSPSFKNILKFPPVTLPSGQKVEIKTNVYNFRINSSFNPKSHNLDLDLPPTDKYFWFRLSGSNLYYSSTESDINILGAIAVRYITSVQHLPIQDGTADSCFMIKDLDNMEWKLCAQSIDIRTKWVCHIQKILEINQDRICSNDSTDSHNQNNEMNTKKIIQPIVIIPIPSPHCNENWNYQSFGRDWQCDCAEGKEQSPIDLPLVDKALDSPVKPLFQYEEIIVKSQTSTLEGQMQEHSNIKLELTNGALRIFHQNFGKVVTLDGAIYHAQEIVIHTPSEHKINGKAYDMELQIIHYGQTKGDIAKQVVLSFLFERKAGVYNKFIDDLEIFNLPNPTNKKVDLVNNLFIPKILYTADDTEIPIMKPFSFYTYQGSISFPPCTEKTVMYVASQPIPIGTTALQLFQEALRVPDLMKPNGDVIVTDFIQNSSREIQPLNGRPVFHYNHEKYCGPDPVKSAPKPVGHYEKIMKSMVNYFYVNHSEPSGIPGAFVVSEKEALGKPLNLPTS
jgi:carbonic anhydrase